jgi:hypothetical protein
MRETVEPSNDDPSCLSSVTTLHGEPEHRPRPICSRHIELFPPLDDLDLVELSPRADLRSLDVGADERLPFATSVLHDDG